MGAGVVGKAVLDGRISLISFGVAQVLIDIEPGVHMLFGWADLHGWSHTLAGALAIGALSTAISPWLIRPLVGRWNTEVHHYRLSWLSLPASPKKWAVATGAFVGTLSHLLLDGLIHADMHPFAPIADANPLLALVAHDEVYALCAVAMGLGSVAWLARKYLQAWRSGRRRQCG